jgi:bifunctional non-homologous end joining protein LigD
MVLEAYRRKRDFSKTTEPRASTARRRGRSSIFVVQEHQARSHHYDFRLEVDGVLKSWAVPKGLPLRPAERRLAVAVEDHPLEYAKFHGDIPTGQYGAGHVDIFDRGTWSPKGDPRAALASGKLEFELHGTRLSGAWVLVRLKDDPHHWLLIRRSGTPLRREASAGPSTRTRARKPARSSSRP